MVSLKRTSSRERGIPTALIPNLITIGNAVCGFGALTLIAGVEVAADGVRNLENLNYAAWLIFLGMLFDVFDGRVARLTGGTSSLGAQLDSLADLVTFGLAPAGMVVTFHRVTFTPATNPAWVKIAWVFGLAYFLGAMLRLARFNVEHDEAEEAHQCFKGLPTPAAAGVVASLVLVYFWLGQWKSWELQAMAASRPEWTEVFRSYIPLVLPFLAFGIGYAMVASQLYYPHVASLMLQKRHSFDTFVFIIFAAILTAFLVEAILCIVFLGYLFLPVVVRERPQSSDDSEEISTAETPGRVGSDSDRSQRPESQPGRIAGPRFRLRRRR